MNPGSPFDRRGRGPAVRTIAAGCVAVSLAILTIVPGARSARGAAARGEARALSIFVDPDVRVTDDGDVAHMEAYGTASSTSADVLIAGGELVVPGRALSATEARLYRSSDAGASWAFHPLPDEVNGGWDNAIAAGVGETVYFLTSNLARGLTLYASGDAGQTWTSAVLPGADNWDRPHIVVDLSRGPNRGRLYVAAEGKDGVRVTSSSDRGRTFSPPVAACPHAPGWNAATTASPIVLGDGTLAVSCAPYPNYPGRATWTAGEAGLVTSADGGATFAAYRKIGLLRRLATREMYRARLRGDVLLSGNFMQGPAMAVAPQGARFADRIYAAWQDIESPSRARLVASWSGDRGATWSAPVAVAPGPGPGSRQGVPMLGVNRDGVVGVAWFESPPDGDGRSYDVFFSASSDGGATFRKAARVSSGTSSPAQGPNVLPAPGVGRDSSSADLVIRMASPFSTRATGGDYSSMAVDAAGRFHPFWADARRGAWQLYTATIRVLADSALAALIPDAPSAPRPCALDRDRVDLLFGAPESGTGRGEASLSVRLRNRSSDTLLEPVTVRASLELPKSSWTRLVPEAAGMVPKILDASSAWGETASFTYPVSRAAPLFPNGVTAPLEWKIRGTNDFMEFSVRASIATGGCTGPR